MAQEERKSYRVLLSGGEGEIIRKKVPVYRNTSSL